MIERAVHAFNQKKADQSGELFGGRYGAGGEPSGDIDALLAGACAEAEIAGAGGLLAALTKRLVERALEVELTDHVGCEPRQEPPGGAGNTRNSPTPKTLICEHGQVGIDALMWR